jgi:hypothetical protein
MSGKPRHVRMNALRIRDSAKAFFPAPLGFGALRREAEQ